MNGGGPLLTEFFGGSAGAGVGAGEAELLHEDTLLYTLAEYEKGLTLEGGSLPRALFPRVFHSRILFFEKICYQVSRGIHDHRRLFTQINPEHICVDAAGNPVLIWGLEDEDELSNFVDLSEEGEPKSWEGFAKPMVSAFLPLETQKRIEKSLFDFESTEALARKYGVESTTVDWHFPPEISLVWQVLAVLGQWMFSKSPLQLFNQHFSDRHVVYSKCSFGWFSSYPANIADVDKRAIDRLRYLLKTLEEGNEPIFSADVRSWASAEPAADEGLESVMVPLLGGPRV